MKQDILNYIKMLEEQKKEYEVKFYAQFISEPKDKNGNKIKTDNPNYYEGAKDVLALVITDLKKLVSKF